MRTTLGLVAAMLLAACGDDPAPPVIYEESGIRVTVWPDSARIEVVRLSDGAVIFDGGAPAFRVGEPAIEFQMGSFKIDGDGDAPWRAIGRFRDVAVEGGVLGFDLDGAGAGTIDIEPEAVAIRIATTGDENRASISFGCAEGEHFLGLGGQSYDVDHRGQTVPLWVEEDGISKREDDRYEGVWFLSGRRHSTHTPMPIAWSSRGYAFAVDTDARAIFELCSVDPAAVRLETWSGELALRLFVPEPDAADPRVVHQRAIDLLTAWTGRPEVAKPVVFAPWLDAIYGSTEVRRVAGALRAADIAVSVIWTEDWRGGNDEGTGYVLEEDWRVDRTLYPDFEAVADDLHGDGFLFLTYYNTFVDEEADVFAEAIDSGHGIHDASGDPYLFTGVKFRDSTMIDLTNATAVEWTKSILREGVAIGADGWMADFAEWLPHDAALADGTSALDAGHNRYPVEWAKLNHDLASESDLLYFMRSAWLGSQPYVQVMWGGDQQTDWTAGDGMRSVIPIGLGLGVTGFPYYGHDIAGYMSQLTVPTTKELWFRWCTLGALSPVMRTHHGRDARNNWNWERDAETIAHLRRWSKLHVQLVPYQQAMAEIAAARGLPLMRPVALEHPEAGDWAWTTTDQYLLGDRILVAPVLDEGATSRTVQFPPGRWYPLLGGASVEGAQQTIAAPVTEIPAFLPEGAILVMYPDTVDTVIDAPAGPQTVTAADVGGDRVVELMPGTPRGEVGRHEQGGTSYVWSGRDPAAGDPVDATWNGATVAVTGEADAFTLTVDGPGELVLAGGGTLAITGDAGATTVRLRRE